MKQKSFHIQLTQTSRSHKNMFKKGSHHFKNQHNYQQTHRSQKFIPIQFRDKRKQITNPIQDNLGKQKQSFLKYGPHIKSSQSIEQVTSTFELKKFGKPGVYIKQLNSDGPKLRQTNSTDCHSPKQSNWIYGCRMKDFIKIKQLGKGKFGQVFLVRHIDTGFIAALKIINKLDLIHQSKQDSIKSINQLIRQIKIQSFLNHPNLIKLYNFWTDSTYFYILMQLATDSHLYSFIQNGKTFTQQSTSIIIRQIAEGINYMHYHNVIHRDLKLQNIVISHGMAKICDFGWSVYCPKQFRSTLCGTPIYLSPQMLSGKMYTKKVDIWAIGSIVHQLFTSRDPFNIKTKQQLNKVIEQDFQMTTGTPQLRSFITFILRKNPSKRPDSETILNHPFISKYRDLQISQQLCRLTYKY